MGVRTRGYDIATYLRRDAANQAPREEVARVVER
jgi:hypothetical protein